MVLQGEEKTFKVSLGIFLPSLLYLEKYLTFPEI